MVNVSESNSSDPSSFPGRAEFNLLFNVDIANPLLKNERGRDRRPHFVIVVVWKALIVGVCMVVAWGRKSYLAPVGISSFVFLIQFKDGGHRVGLDFIFLFLMWIQEMKILSARMCVQRFSCASLRDGKVRLRSSASS